VIIFFVPFFIRSIHAQTKYFSYVPLLQKCSTPAYSVINGDFEQGDVGWTFSPQTSGIATLSNGISAHGGVLMAYMRHYGGPELIEGYIEQSFTVPDCSPYLSFWWSAFVKCDVVSGSRCGGDLSIYINGTPFTSYRAAGGGIKSWERGVLDLNAYRGSDVTFRFAAKAVRDTIDVHLDDIAFQNYP
jgi:hypothetical protein